MKRKIIKIFKQNKSAIICFVLALSVFVTGSISFARYATSHTGIGGAGVGSFSCSATVDGVSALSFTNTAFWGGSVEEDKIAMNALRSLNFTVNNYESSNGVKRVSEVQLSYSLSFTTPANFADKLAIQLLDNKGNPILPQMIVPEIMNAVSGETGTGTYDTEKRHEDYNGLECEEMIFAVSKYKNGEGGTVVEAKAADGTVIKIETMEKEYEQTLLFRLWDVSKLTSESSKTVANEQGDLLPPLEVKYRDTLECYKISIKKADFVFPAAVESSASYSLTLAPTDTLLDNHLGGYAFDANGDALTQIASGSDFALKNITKTTTYYTDSSYTQIESAENTPHETNPYEESLMGGIPVHTVGDGEEELISSTDNGQLTDFPVHKSETNENAPSVTVYYYYTRAWNYGSYTYTLVDVTTDGNAHNRSDYYRVTRTFEGKEKKTEQYYLSTSFSSITTRQTNTTEVSDDGNSVKQQIIDRTKYTLGNITGYKTTTTEFKSTSASGDKLQQYWNGKWSDSSYASGFDITTAKNPNNYAINSYSTAPTTVQQEMTSAEIDKYDEKLPSGTDEDIHYLTIQYTMSNPVTVTPSSVSRHLKVEDDEGVYYDSENPLKFFEGDIQKMYLSQCFSKDYPTSVSVLFEQVVD
ncbi:MAG: hypothetical protein IJY69_02110 [Clostridia bacterium]|nr:hypothetical protein [Clostridia bacterium]